MNKRKCSDYSDVVLPKVSRIDEVIARGNNCLMMLNELGIKGLKWQVEQMSNQFPQKFHASCQFTEPFSGNNIVIPVGKTFFVEGTSKNSCKHELANQIIDYLKNDNNKNDHYTKEIILPPLINNNTVKPLPPNPASDEIINDITIEDAVRILNEKIKEIDYNFKLTDDGYSCVASIRGFVFKASGSSKKIAKRSVAVQALKKLFKFKFIDEKLNNTGGTSEIQLKYTIQKIPFNRQKNFSNFIESIIKTSFEKLISDLEVQYSKRKVLSGILISRKLKEVFPSYVSNISNSIGTTLDPIQFFSQTGWHLNPDDHGEIVKIITITTGTKCVSGNDLDPNGNVVNDCHAEVVAKRALQYFLYQTIKRYLQNSANESNYNAGDELYGCDILSPYNKENPYVYRLKPDVKFHIYISSAPCGDSRIFHQQIGMSKSGSSSNLMLLDDSDEFDDSFNNDSHPNRKNRGLLRTKIECGEGTIPLKEKRVQTWDGIMGGERLLTMSCSDKVCLWNVLGLQGALLSNMLCEPVYLDSIIIGSIFHQEHLQRALFERASPVTTKPDWFNDKSKQEPMEDGELTISNDLKNCRQMNESFRVNCPLILTVSNQEERIASKASNYSFNWILGEQDIEIIHTSKGITIENARSRLCKRNLFKSFLSVFHWLKLIIKLNNNENNKPDDNILNYIDYKNLNSIPENALGSILYQHKKTCLFKFFNLDLDLGCWVAKPIESDWFGVSKNYIYALDNIKLPKDDEFMKNTTNQLIKNQEKQPKQDKNNFQKKNETNQPIEDYPVKNEPANNDKTEITIIPIEDYPAKNESANNDKTEIMIRPKMELIEIQKIEDIEPGSMSIDVNMTMDDEKNKITTIDLLDSPNGIDLDSD